MLENSTERNVAATVFPIHCSYPCIQPYRIPHMQICCARAIVAQEPLLLQWDGFKGAVAPVEAAHAQHNVQDSSMQVASLHDDGSWSARGTGVLLSPHAENTSSGTALTSQVSAAGVQCAPVELKESVVWGAANTDSSVAAVVRKAQPPCSEEAETASSSSSLAVKGCTGEKKLRAGVSSPLTSEGREAAVKEFAAMNAGREKQEGVIQLHMWRSKRSWFQWGVLAAHVGVKVLVALGHQAFGTHICLVGFSMNLGYAAIL
jgi:hypothetical protein